MEMLKADSVGEVMVLQTLSTETWGIGAIPHTQSQKKTIVDNLKGVGITEINGRLASDYILNQNEKLLRPDFKELKFDV